MANQLNDDCLLHIFSFLPMNDMLKVEKVCRRWERISLMAWRNVVFSLLEMCYLEVVLQKYGKHIIRLQIGQQHYYKTDEFYFKEKELFGMINKFCKKLCHLSVFIYKYFLNDLNKKKYSFLKKLKSLKINGCGIKLDNHMLLDYVVPFLENLNNLEKFYFYEECDFEVVDIHFLSKNLRLCHVVFEINVLKQLFNQFKKLTEHTEGKNMEVHLVQISGSLHEVLNSISDQLTFLELRTCMCFIGNEYQQLKLDNLETLILDDVDYTDDDVIFAFVKNSPRLKKIEISHCGSITDEGYRFLGRLSALASFHTDSLNISSATLEFLAAKCNELEEIKCSVHSILNSSELINIITSSQNLKYLKTKEFKHLPKEWVKSALETVRRRINGIKLNIAFADNVERHELKQFGLKEKTGDLRLGSTNEDSLTISLHFGPSCFFDVRQFLVDDV